MHINLSSFSQNILYFFYDDVVTFLKENQKTVVIVASVAFALLATAFIVKRCYFNAKIDKVEPKVAFKEVRTREFDKKAAPEAVGDLDSVVRSV